ncbi:hypothetical protein INR49_006980 [Caranx melampygus]|nr:hypothetical protein INR49_006980 [Caranx melampygus]
MAGLSDREQIKTERGGRGEEEEGEEEEEADMEEADLLKERLQAITLKVEAPREKDEQVE